MICTAPDETRVVNGVEVTLPCWEREFNFSCVIRPENPSCSYLQEAGCKPSTDNKKAETLSYDCREETIFKPHEDIQFIENSISLTVSRLPLIPVVTPVRKRKVPAKSPIPFLPRFVSKKIKSNSAKRVKRKPVRH